MERYNNTIQETNGDIITTATVTVYLSNSGSLASIFQDDETTALNNPFTISDPNYTTDGAFWFKAADSLYDIKVVDGASTTWIRDETLYDVTKDTLVYVEGVFTATLRGSTGEPGTLITQTNAPYTRIGRLIHFEISIENVNTTGYSGNITLDGLPFSKSGIGRSELSVDTFQSTLWSDQLVAEIATSSSSITLWDMRTGASHTQATHQVTGGGRYFWITGTYVSSL